MKKRTLLIAATLLCALILSSSYALSAQQVEVPYVVSGDGWWTGIAITNKSGDPITDMKLSFTTDEGVSGYNLPSFDPPVKTAIPGIFITYSTNLDEIAGHAMQVDLLSTLYTGEGTKTLPSDRGSVIFSHTGDEEFYVTAFVGGPDGGFAYQVFESDSP